MLFQRSLTGMVTQITATDNEINKKNIKKKSIERIVRSLRTGFLFLFPPISRTRAGLSGKVSLRASFRAASVAVETALVLPVFFLGMVTMISFMDIYKIQTEHLSALCDRVKEAGMYAYVADGTGVEDITLPDAYVYEPIGGLVPLPDVYMFNFVKVHAWTGKEFQGSDFSDGQEKTREEMVYVTENGNVFHKSAQCTYLDLSITKVPGGSVSGMRNEYGEKYHSCEICGNDQAPSETVFITNTGNKYHNTEACSGLKRTVRMVKHSQADHMRACSRCGG